MVHEGQIGECMMEGGESNLGSVESLGQPKEGGVSPIGPMVNLDFVHSPGPQEGKGSKFVNEGSVKKRNSSREYLNKKRVKKLVDKPLNSSTEEEESQDKMQVAGFSRSSFG